jgi:hypothetical protein
MPNATHPLLIKASPAPLIALVGSLLCLPRPCHAQTAGSLTLGDIRITISANAGVTVFKGTIPVLSQPAPLQVEVVDDGGTAVWKTGNYDAVRNSDKGLVCQGTVLSAAGTWFRFMDQYQISNGAFVINHSVAVDSKALHDAGFSSRFSLPAVGLLKTTDCDFLAPGVWYGQNEHAPATAIAGHMEDRAILIREDRLSSPMLMLRRRDTGLTVELLRLDGNADSISREDGLNRLISPDFKYGSLGVLNTGSLAPLFQYPGTEGERTYVYGPSKEGGRFALRSHPITPGFRQDVTLSLRVYQSVSYSEAVKTSQRYAYRVLSRTAPEVDAKAAYLASMQMLASYCKRYKGAIGLPFAVRVPNGEAYDTSCQMGFVGDALPAAALLLRHSLETGSADVRQHAADLVDYWVKNSKTPAGVLKTWYDIQPDGSVTWRTYPQFLRVASDGVTGVLHAWSILKSKGENHPEWLKFCTDWADWLIKNQNAEGAWYRSWKLDGVPEDRSTDTTIQPISLLVELGMVTGEPRWKQAALKAGQFCLRTVHNLNAYVGGTPDNPNTADKEACILSASAFLSLYDQEKDPLWLDAATRAANFAETWMYLRNIALPASDPENIYPQGRSTVGVSLIALGHSGADNFMAATPFLWYRLYIATGDEHYRSFASLVQNACLQMLDLDGSLHYAHKGMLTEALTLAPLRGHGVKSWLPWLSVTVLDPLAGFQDAFGNVSLSEIIKTDAEKQKQQMSAYAQTHGLEKVASP